MTTAEITKAISQLSNGTLVASLKTFHEDVDVKDPNLQNKYTDTVLSIGLQNFIEKLKGKDITDACKAVGADTSSTNAAEALKEALKNGGINLLLSKADDALLKSFCGILGLAEPTQRDNMIKEIADETMLTGMESFLNKINSPTLKRHCIEMKLSGSGNKYSMVERLMVYIFQLEPLGNEETGGRKKAKAKETKEKAPKETKEKETKSKTTKGKAEKPAKEEKEKASPRSSPKRGRSADKEEKKEKAPAKRGRSASTESSPSKKQKRSTTRSASPVSKPTKSKRATASPSPSPKKASPKKASPSGKKEKWVAPPLSTIAKGQHDTKIALNDNFNLPDLVKFAKDNNLPSSGKKLQVIKVILDFLDGKQPAEKKPKAKKAKKAASPAAKKQKTTAATTKKNAAETTK